MRGVAPRFLLTATLISVLTATGRAAPATPVDENAEAETRLDAVLREWAKASDAVQEAHFKIRVTETDRVADVTRDFGMEVFVKKPDLMRLDFKTGKGDWDAAVVYKEKTVHLFSPRDRTDRFFALPETFGFPERADRYPKETFGGLFLGNLLERCSWLAFGPPVRDLKSRFDLVLAHEDDNWIYLQSKRGKERDGDAFKRIQVVLNRKTFQIRRLWIEQPNDVATTYNFDPPNEDSAESVTPETVMDGLTKEWKKGDMQFFFDLPLFSKGDK